MEGQGGAGIELLYLTDGSGRCEELFLTMEVFILLYFCGVHRRWMWRETSSWYNLGLLGLTLPPLGPSFMFALQSDMIWQLVPCNDVTPAVPADLTLQQP